MAAPIITQERLREVLEYFPESGMFVWRVRTNNRIKSGGVAGYLRPDGYIHIKVDGRRYLAHRLAWVYVTGTWPANQIDHRDGNPANSRFNNLREATPGENKQNMRQAPRHKLSSGLLGVTWDKNREKWQARIGLDGKDRHLGYFKTAALAHVAYIEAKRSIHPFGTL